MKHHGRNLQIGLDSQGKLVEFGMSGNIGGGGVRQNHYVAREKDLD